MNIIVKELPRTLTEKELLQLFLPFGEVRACNIVKEAGTGKSKGFGFVEMPDNLQAREAIKTLHNKTIDDTRIRVKMIPRKYEPTSKRPTKAKTEYTGPRSFGAITRTEEMGTDRSKPSRGRVPATRQRPEGSYGSRRPGTGSQEAAKPIRGRGPATPNRSGSSGSTSSGWTRSRSEAEGGNRTPRYSDRGTPQSPRSEGSYRARPTRSRTEEIKKTIRGRGPATSKHSEGRGSTGSVWTRSRSEAAGGNRTSRYSDRNTSRPVRAEGSYLPRYEKNETQGTKKPFRGTGKNIYSDRDAASPERLAGNYRTRPAKTGEKQTANPAKGPRAAKRGRTPARPVKIGRSGARQGRPAKRGKR